MIGGKIKDRLKELNMSQYQLAKEAGFTRSYIAMLCRDERGQKLPMGTLKKLAGPLQVTLDYFWSENPNSGITSSDL